jgi:hypothetical protein
MRNSYTYTEIQQAMDNCHESCEVVFLATGIKFLIDDGEDLYAPTIFSMMWDRIEQLKDNDDEQLLCTA